MSTAQTGAISIGTVPTGTVSTGTAPVGAAKAALTSRVPLLMQVLKFGAVGGVGFVVNLVVFNVLLATVFHPRGVHFGPLYATVAATVVAIAVNWLGNRYWAFSSGRQSNTAREGAEFFAVSLIGMAIPLLCVWRSHYVMHLTSPLADNIANNVVGLVLGMLFRFALYRWWVFAPSRRESSSAG
jgi:putative flippase GtrA